MAAAQVIMQGGPFGLTSMDLTLQRRTQEFTENSVYRLAENGDFEGVEKAMMSHKGLPADAADSNGYTALHIRILIWRDTSHIF
jgi:hypothetical protein